METINAAEAAEYIGINYQMLINFARQNKIPHIKFGSRYYFREETIDRWLSEQEAKSTKETNYEIRRKKE